MAALQFRLRASAISRPGVRPTSLPEASLRIMYGPANATYWSYVEGLWASKRRAYSSGTGVEIGMASAWLTSGALGVER